MRTWESSSRLPARTSVLCTTIFFSKVETFLPNNLPGKKPPNQQVGLWCDVTPKSVHSEVLLHIILGTMI